MLLRAAIIFGLGLALNLLASLTFGRASVRIPGVLQRIAVCYFFAALAYLAFGRKGILPAAAALLLGYWLLMTRVPVPGLGTGRLDVEGNLAAYIDRLILGDHTWKHNPNWDPEGLLSTLPAIATTLLGILAGLVLLSDRPLDGKITRLLAWGWFAGICGLVWNLVFPINKNLWTSSYAVFMSGLASAALGICVWAIDRRGWKSWAKPFVWLGTNALALFVRGRRPRVPAARDSRRQTAPISLCGDLPDPLRPFCRPAPRIASLRARLLRVLDCRRRVVVSSENLPQGLTEITHANPIVGPNRSRPRSWRWSDALMQVAGAGARRRREGSDPRLARAWRFEQNGWIFVHLEGSPSTIGFQHGSLLAAEIADAFEAVKLSATHSTQKTWPFFRDAAREMLWPKMDSEYQEEIRGIVEGLASQSVRMDVDDVVALNAFEELPDYYVPWYNEQHKIPGPKITSPGNCSAFVATGSYTKDGKIVDRAQQLDELLDRRALADRFRHRSRERPSHPDGRISRRHHER